MVHFGLTLSRDISDQHPDIEHFRWGCKEKVRSGYTRTNENNFQGFASLAAPVLQRTWSLQLHRWIMDAFRAMSKMSCIFARNPAGPMPDHEIQALQHEYLAYRTAYNRPLHALFQNQLETTECFVGRTVLSLRPCSLGIGFKALAFPSSSKSPPVRTHESCTD